MEIYNLTEIFRKLYPELKCTWRQTNLLQQAALALLTIML